MILVIPVTFANPRSDRYLAFFGDDVKTNTPEKMEKVYQTLQNHHVI